MSIIVETSYGKLEGAEQEGVCSFKGIPFALPPVGSLRFAAPEKPHPWAGVRQATAFGAAAAQNQSVLGPAFGFDIGPSGEDCLYLNVWTPRPDGGRRPVMVWIHGGAFVMGAGSQALYDGSALVRRGDVVVVTINYRLGGLGFLHLPTHNGDRGNATANAGLLDQIAALEWVRDEIASFGGDPGNVTIFGESAGSISVATLLGTPRAQGLFHRAILQSGSANLVASVSQAARVTAAFLQQLDLGPAETAKLYEVPAARMLEVQQRLYAELQPKLRGLAFAPVVDGEVVPQHPFESIRAGSARGVALLVGTNLDEMKLFGIMDPGARQLDEAALLQRCERNIPGTDGRGTSRGRCAIDTYRDARARREEPIEPPELWFAIETDRTFRYPAMHLAELQHAHQPHVYAYLFTWPSPFLGGMLGACHALELPFVFGTRRDPMLAKLAGDGPAAEELAGRMQDAWLAFAHGGALGRAGLGDWPEYDATRRATMLLGSECGVVDAPREEERRFWEFWDGTL